MNEQASVPVSGSLKDGFEIVAQLWSTFLDRPVTETDTPTLMRHLAAARGCRPAPAEMAIFFQLQDRII